VILVGHRLTTISQSDRIYVIKDGTIVESGSVNNLIEYEGLFYSMFQKEIGRSLLLHSKDTIFSIH
jgi:ABC-type multidrug transport system fused ATPase/permease subunit